MHNEIPIEKIPVGSTVTWDVNPDKNDRYERWLDEKMPEFIKRFTQYKHKCYAVLPGSFASNADQSGCKIDDAQGSVSIGKRVRDNGEKPLYRYNYKTNNFVPVPRFETTYWLTGQPFSTGRYSYTILERHYDALRKIWLAGLAKSNTYGK